MAVVIDLQRPFDPDSPEAEIRYNEVVRRLTRMRVLRRQLGDERAELERRFLQGEPGSTRGRRRRRPFARSERHEQLTRWLELSFTLRDLEMEEAWFSRQLHRMNAALDDWARTNYGGGSAFPEG